MRCRVTLSESSVPLREILDVMDDKTFECHQTSCVAGVCVCVGAGRAGSGRGVCL